MTKSVHRYVLFVVCLSACVASLMAMKLVPAAAAWRRGENAETRGAVTHQAQPGLAMGVGRLANIAAYARVTAFSAPDAASDSDGAGIVDAEEWTSGPQPTGSWIMLEWNKPAVVQGIDLFERESARDGVLGGLLTFSDGSVVQVGPLPPDASPARIRFQPKCVRWVRFRVGNRSGTDAGLADIAVHGTLNPWSRTPAGLASK